MSDRSFFNCSSSIANPGSIFVLEKRASKIVRFLWKILPFFPMLYAISTASSVLKYIDNCDVESDVSKSLCINLISSGITEFIYADIFCVASDFVRPETSIFFIYTPFAIVVLFILINENVQKIIIVNNMKIEHKIPKIISTSDFSFWLSWDSFSGLNSLFILVSLF